MPDTFDGIKNSIVKYNAEWEQWYKSVDAQSPYTVTLPGDWDTNLDSKLEKMLVLRCFREDRITHVLQDFVGHLFEKDFLQSVESNPAQIKDAIEESTPQTPIVIVLSPGLDATSTIMDPIHEVLKLSKEKGVELETISIGKGLSQREKQAMTNGAVVGKWVFLMNCQVSIGILNDLEQKFDELIKQDVHANFRLILSSNPHPNFSIPLLQRSVKIIQEPTKGIKTNILKQYERKSEFTSAQQTPEFRKAFYSLCYFHAIMIERQRFQGLGWNKNYSFNEADFKVCENFLTIYLDQKNVETNALNEFQVLNKSFSWSNISMIISDFNYGGRITDDKDRRLNVTLAKAIFNENIIIQDKWIPNGTNESMNYGYPIDETAFKQLDQSQMLTPQYFYQEIQNKMVNQDLPQVFGQHVNAEISAQLNNSQQLLNEMISITPQIKVDVGALAQELQKKVPSLIDYHELKQRLNNGQDDPFNNLLLYEVSYYRALIERINNDLKMLEKSLLGFVVHTSELEKVYDALQQNTVPFIWAQRFFRSQKSLANYIQDLNERYKFFRNWVVKGTPLHFWIGAFFNTDALNYSILQKFARSPHTNAAFDDLILEYIPVDMQPSDIMETPEHGVYATNLYLEGAAWDFQKHCLKEPNVMQLTTQMPVMHFKPTEKRTNSLVKPYNCPVWYTDRSGIAFSQNSFEHNRFQFYIQLESGDKDSDFWVMRGTAIALSLAT